MKLSSALSVLVTAFMSFMLATTALPGLPLKNRGEPGTISLGTTTDYVLAWCKYTAGMLFQWDLPTFIRHREANFKLGVLEWDWSSDGCTAVPDSPMGYPFKPACQRHDFGYRNYRIQNHFTPHARWKIDQNFLKDMKFQCKGHTNNIIERAICHNWAHTYWWGVRQFYKNHEQYCPKRSIGLMDTVESMDVFEGMDADEARDAANPDLPKEKVKEYYDRALARCSRLVG